MPHQSYIGEDGKAWPSATELTSLIPKNFLWNWYKRSVQKDGWNGWLANEAASEAGKKTGTLVHYFLECLVKGEKPELEDANNAAAIASSIFHCVDPLIEEYVDVEPHLVSTELKLHGTADAIIRRNYETGLWVLDYKTAKEKDSSHPIQLAIYALAWNETHPDQKIDQGFIARVDKKSINLTVKLDDYRNLSQYYPVVRALRTLWSYTNGE